MNNNNLTNTQSMLCNLSKLMRQEHAELESLRQQLKNCHVVITKLKHDHADYHKNFIDSLKAAKSVEADLLQLQKLTNEQDKRFNFMSQLKIETPLGERTVGEIAGILYEGIENE